MDADRNAELPAEQQAGFHGLGPYSMGSSIHAVIGYPDGVDPEVAKVARKRYRCLKPEPNCLWCVDSKTARKR